MSAGAARGDIVLASVEALVNAIRYEKDIRDAGLG